MSIVWGLGHTYNVFHTGDRQWEWLHCVQWRLWKAGQLNTQQRYCCAISPLPSILSLPPSPFHPLPFTLSLSPLLIHPLPSTLTSKPLPQKHMFICDQREDLTKMIQSNARDNVGFDVA